MKSREEVRRRVPPGQPPKACSRIAAAVLAFALVAGCAHPTRLSIYDEAHRPSGYHWLTQRVPGTTTVEYFAKDPSDGWTVWVGPDGVYYTFAHPPPITTGDLHSYWDPHDARRPTAAPTRPALRRSSAVPVLRHRAGRTRSAHRTRHRRASARG
jgi:hypothetical protein